MVRYLHTLTTGRLLNSVSNNIQLPLTKIL